MKVAIFAELTLPQLNHLRELAEQQGIDANFVVEGEAVTPAPRTTSTPLTGMHFDAAAQATGATAVQIAQQATRFGITTVEEALAHNDIPAAVKHALEATL